MDFNIRRANIDDYDKINNLNWQSDLYHYNNEPYIYEKTNEGGQSKDYIESLINDKKNLLFLKLKI
jgi:hypothetical protein